MVNKDINSNNLIPIEKLKDETIWNDYKSKYPDRFQLSYHNFINQLDNVDLNLRHIYFNLEGLASYIYYNSPVLIDIYGLDNESLAFTQIKERIEKSHEFLSKCIENKDFYKLFAFVDQRISFSVYKDIFELIPDNEKFNVFKEIYSLVDYGFNNIEPSFIRQVFSYKHDDVHMELLKPYIKNNKVVIYRGEGSQSTSHKEAYSWSLKIETACYFATRFNIDGKVYKAEIDVKHIVAYLDNRNEFEVLLLPEHVENIKLISMFKSEDIVNELESSGLLKVYQHYCNKIKNDLFLNPKGQHGVLHTKRVLLNNLILAMKYGLEKEYINILAFASIYHDIGRENDESDLIHGQKSVEKINNTSLPLLKNSHHNDIIKFIIANHNIEDEEAIQNLKQYQYEDENKIIFIFKIFKDADGLDRVRFKDLNVKYLRKNISEKMLMFSYQSVQQIQ